MNFKQLVKILLIKFLKNYHASFVWDILERTLLYSETCLIWSLCNKVTGLSQLT